ncbi:MAG: 50S ribosomal protein L19 [Planctomycetes bacterium]|nr:50S ribosomal protein L19 [Planctomycetota bacterium]
MSTQELIESLNSEALKTDLPRMDVGDTIRVHNRIVEGQKEWVQGYEGVLISRKGRGINEMITVRRVVNDYGVERTWPINSPMIAKIEVVRRADARRAKLYFLRDRIGKARRLREIRVTKSKGGKAAQAKAGSKSNPELVGASS